MNQTRQLQNIIAEHCAFLDGGDHEAYAGLFSKKGRLIMHDRVMAEGRDAIREWVATHAMPPGRHATTNVRIYREGNKARGYSTVLYISSHLTISAVRDYQVDFVKRKGTWKISEWRVIQAMPPAVPASPVG